MLNRVSDSLIISITFIWNANDSSNEYNRQKSHLRIFFDSLFFVQEYKNLKNILIHFQPLRTSPNFFITKKCNLENVWEHDYSWYRRWLFSIIWSFLQYSRQPFFLNESLNDSCSFINLYSPLARRGKTSKMMWFFQISMQAKIDEKRYGNSYTYRSN